MVRSSTLTTRISEKREGEEIAPEEPPTLVNAKEKRDEEVIPLTSNSKGTAENRQLIKEPEKDLSIPIPFKFVKSLIKKESIMM